MTGIPQLPFHMAIDTVVMAILFAVAWIDWHERRIPNSTLLMLLACTVFQFAAVRMSLVDGLSLRDLAVNLSVAAVLFVPAYGAAPAADFQEKARRVRFLQYRGFTAEQIREVRKRSANPI